MCYSCRKTLTSRGASSNCNHHGVLLTIVFSDSCRLVSASIDLDGGAKPAKAPSELASVRLVESRADATQCASDDGQRRDVKQAGCILTDDSCLAQRDSRRQASSLGAMPAASAVCAVTIRYDRVRSRDQEIKRSRDQEIKRSKRTDARHDGRSR